MKLKYDILLCMPTLFFALVLIAFSGQSSANQDNGDSVSSVSANYQLNPSINGLPQSWGLAVSPNNELFISHRKGGFSKLSLAEEGDTNALKSSLTRIDFLPNDLLTGGQGGLLDIIFHPDYARNGWIYLSYSAGTSDANGLKIVRFQLSNNSVENLQTVFEIANKKDTPVHYGARMAFDQDGSLLVTTGDGFDYREKAQVKDNQLGKILRMSDEGKAHPQNPFYEDGDSPSAFVFSLGHRNPQGLLVTENGTIVEHEHGPDGGDEINVIEAGVNYGWPVITKGMDYIGATISPFTEYPGMHQPDLDWTPSIAPSGMTYYQSDKHPALTNHLLVTSLKFQQIYAVPFTDNSLGEDFTLLGSPEVRLRDIEYSASGSIWVLGDGEPATLYKLSQP